MSWYKIAKNHLIALFFFLSISLLPLLCMEEREGTQKPTIGTRSSEDQEKLNQELATAAYQGNVNRIKELLERGADVNYRSRDEGAGMTPLHWAAQNNKPLAIVALLNAGADINAQKKGGFAALHIAAHYEHYEAVNTLMERGVDKLVKSDDGRTAFQIACERKNKRLIARLKKQPNTGSILTKLKGLVVQDAGSSSLIATNKNDKALLKAAKDNKLDEVLFLIKKGARVNAIDKEDGSTALHLLRNNPKAVEELMKLGAKMYAKDHRFNTPLCLTAYNGYTEAMKVFLKNGCNVNWHSLPGSSTLLHHAAESGKLEMVELLVAKGADPNALAGGVPPLYTPLDYARRNGHAAVARFLEPLTNPTINVFVHVHHV